MTVAARPLVARPLAANELVRRSRARTMAPEEPQPGPWLSARQASSSRLGRRSAWNWNLIGRPRVEPSRRGGHKSVTCPPNAALGASQLQLQLGRPAGGRRRTTMVVTSREPAIRSPGPPVVVVVVVVAAAGPNRLPSVSGGSANKTKRAPKRLHLTDRRRNR